MFTRYVWRLWLPATWHEEISDFFLSTGISKYLCLPSLTYLQNDGCWHPKRPSNCCHSMKIGAKRRLLLGNKVFVVVVAVFFSCCLQNISKICRTSCLFQRAKVSTSVMAVLWLVDVLQCCWVSCIFLAMACTVIEYWALLCEKNDTHQPVWNEEGKEGILYFSLTTLVKV